mgnify:FL=1
MLFALSVMACSENNIAYDEVINVPQGIYLSGSSSEFSLPIETGRLRAVESDNENMLSIRAWLKADGRFQISFVDTDGQPQTYGMGSKLELANAYATSYSLTQGGEGFTVPTEGLYQVVVNKARKELTIIPIQFTMQGDNALTEEGNNDVPLSDVTYDRLTHVVTWCNADSTKQLLPGKYIFKMNDGEKLSLRDSETENYNLSTIYTGTAATERTNQLDETFRPLTNQSAVKLKFPLKGKYSVKIQYSVLTGKFTARMGGKGVEVTGMSNDLYMGVSNFGVWNSNDVVKMAPVGAVGNGEFWHLCYLKAGQTVEWSTSKDGSQLLSSWQTTQGVEMTSDGKATVKTSALYLVYANLDRKLIAFETPQVYASGAALGDNEKPLEINGSNMSIETTETGNLNIFATSNQNARNWSTMQMTVRNGKIVYPGTSVDQMPGLPVSKGTTVTLDVANNTADFGGTTPEVLIPEGVKQLYMIGDSFGEWDWTSSKVVSMENGYAGDSRWFYISYMRAGETLSFSTDKAFGKGNFAQLKKVTDYKVENDKAVVEKEGIYMVYVGLDTREIAIQPLTLSGDCGGASVNFTINDDGQSMSATIAKGGRMRIYPQIPAVKGIKTFGSWKREVYVDPETGDFLYRKNGDGEPNKDYVWKAGTKITINFVTMKSVIEEP